MVGKCTAAVVMEVRECCVGEDPPPSPPPPDPVPGSGQGKESSGVNRPCPPIAMLPLRPSVPPAAPQRRRRGRRRHRSRPPRSRGGRSQRPTSPPGATTSIRVPGVRSGGFLWPAGGVGMRPATMPGAAAWWLCGPCQWLVRGADSGEVQRLRRKWIPDTFSAPQIIIRSLHFSAISF